MYVFSLLMVFCTTDSSDDPNLNPFEMNVLIKQGGTCAVPRAAHRSSLPLETFTEGLKLVWKSAPTCSGASFPQTRRLLLFLGVDPMLLHTILSSDQSLACSGGLHDYRQKKSPVKSRRHCREPSRWQPIDETPGTVQGDNTVYFVL